MIRQIKDVRGRTACGSVPALAGTVALVAFAMVAEAAIVKTTGKAKSDTTRTEAGLNAATGSACVDVSSGAVSNPNPLSLFGACAAPGTIGGLGKTKAKFIANAQGVLDPQTDLFVNLASATGITGATTLAWGSASWTSFILILPGGVSRFGAEHTAKASVTNTSYTGLTGPSGSAEAEATDPMIFTNDNSGVLQYTLTFGSTYDEPFSFVSDSPAGYGSIEFRAEFSNVSSTYPALPLSLDGELIAVVFEASGVVDAPEDLNIVVEAWPGLGLTSEDLLNAAEFLRASMSVLSDGSVGFAGDVPFIGPGGFMPTIELAYEPGEVYYEDHLLTTAEMLLSDPEPVSIVSSNPPDGHIDPLDTGPGNALTAGIGGAGTAMQGPVQYATIAVTFSGEPSFAPTPANVNLTCTPSATLCPTVVDLDGSGSGPYQIALSGVIPPMNCVTLSFDGPSFVPGTSLHYRSSPGNVNTDLSANKQDVLDLIQALNNGSANSNPQLYNVNRSTGGGPQVNTQDILRLIQLLNGFNTVRPFYSTPMPECQ